MKRYFQIIVAIIFSAVSYFAQSTDRAQIESLLNQSRKNQSDIKKAIEFADAARSQSEIIGYNFGKAEALSLLSDLYKKNNDYVKAAEYTYEKIKLHQRLDEPNNIAKCYIQLAELYRASANYPTGIVYAKKSIALCKEQNDNKNLVYAYNRLSSIYYELFHYNKSYCDSAISAVNISIELSKKIKFDSLEVSNLNLLAGLTSMKGNREAGLSYLKKALSLAVNKNNIDEITLITANIANTYYFLQDYYTSIEYATKSYELAKEYNIMPYIDMSSYFLLLSYEKIGDYKNAYKFQEINRRNHEAIYDIQKTNQLTLLKLKFDAEQNEATLQKEEKIKILQYFLFFTVSFIIVSAITFLAFRNKFIKKKNKELEEKNLLITSQNQMIINQNKELNELNITKDKFFSIIAHDLRNPFYGIMGLSDILTDKNEEVSEDEKQEILKEIKDLSTNTYRMLENLLDWSRTQTGRMEFHPKQIDIEQLILDNINQIKKSAEIKRIHLSSEVEKNLFAFADENMVNTVLRNLISNAIKFTAQTGSILISSRKFNGSIEISIRDTGVGMDEKAIAQLFKLDKTIQSVGTAGEKGTGLGMVLCKEFIGRNNGTIQVESEIGKGSKFSFSLPIHQY